MRARERRDAAEVFRARHHISQEDTMSLGSMEDISRAVGRVEQPASVRATPIPFVLALQLVLLTLAFELSENQTLTSASCHVIWRELAQRIDDCVHQVENVLLMSKSSMGGV